MVRCCGIVPGPAGVSLSTIVRPLELDRRNEADRAEQPSSIEPVDSLVERGADLPASCQRRAACGERVGHVIHEGADAAVGAQLGTA